jgi:hypothetical protein
MQIHNEMRMKVMARQVFDQINVCTKVVQDVPLAEDNAGASLDIPDVGVVQLWRFVFPMERRSRLNYDMYGYYDVNTDTLFVHKASVFLYPQPHPTTREGIIKSMQEMLDNLPDDIKNQLGDIK